MSSASALALPRAHPGTLSLWIQQAIKTLRAPVTRRSPGSRQEAEQLRATARGMMRIDAGYAADLFAAADRHEFGDRA